MSDFARDPTKVVSSDLLGRIRRIPGRAGFDTKRAEEIYLAAAGKLIGHGLSADEIVEILEDLYYAAAECYGA